MMCLIDIKNYFITFVEESMNLREQFRLFYGEGTGKKVEADFNLFRLGYEVGIKESKYSSKYMIKTCIPNKIESCLPNKCEVEEDTSNEGWNACIEQFIRNMEDL